MQGCDEAATLERCAKAVQCATLPTQSAWHVQSS